MRQPNNPRRGRGRGGNRKPNQRNTTFDSNGPQGRVRGTAQQLHDKYQTLARDASSSGDRIMAENFYQHADHYYRLYAAALQPQDQAGDKQGEARQNGKQPPADDRQARNENGADDGQDGSTRRGRQRRNGRNRQDGDDDKSVDPTEQAQPELKDAGRNGAEVELSPGDQSAEKAKAESKPAKAKADDNDTKEDGDADGGPDGEDDSATPRRRARRRPRAASA